MSQIPEAFSGGVQLEKTGLFQGHQCSIKITRPEDLDEKKYQKYLESCEKVCGMCIRRTYSSCVRIKIREIPRNVSIATCARNIPWQRQD